MESFPVPFGRLTSILKSPSLYLVVPTSPTRLGTVRFKLPQVVGGFSRGSNWSESVMSVGSICQIRVVQPSIQHPLSSLSQYPTLLEQ
jgi:hypothetical protein